MKREGFEGQRSIVLPAFLLEQNLDHPLSRTLYISDIGYYPSALNHSRSRPEGSDQYILIYCTKGRGWVSAEGKRSPVCANQYFIIPKGIAHSYSSAENDPWSIYWIHYDGSYAEYFNGNPQQGWSVSPVTISSEEDRFRLFEEMILILEMGYSIENITYAGICLWHFLASFRFHDQFNQYRQTREMDMTESSIRFMKENLRVVLSLKQLANNTGYSISHYSLEFRKKTGHSPMEYLIHLKMQYACQLLAHTSLKVQEIGIGVGYHDPYYFSRIFRKIMGHSPRKYRERLTG